MTDEERQLDEIQVLESIYENELTIASRWPISGCLRISPINPKGNEFDINTVAIVNQTSVKKKIKVKYLIPIELYFRCPVDYPSTSQPLFMLKCIWLPQHLLTRICHNLDKLWDRHQSEILFEWASFIKEDCLSVIPIEELTFTSNVNRVEERHQILPIHDGNVKFRELNKARVDKNFDSLKLVHRKVSRNRKNQDISSKSGSSFLHNYKYETPKDLERKRNFTSVYPKRNISDELTSGANPDESKHQQPKQDQQNTRYQVTMLDYILEMMPTFGVHRKTNSKEFDSRIIVDGFTSNGVTSINTLQQIIDYNEECLQREFALQPHYCEICFEQKSGSLCVCIKPCEHVFCKDCVREYLEINIGSGNVRLGCLNTDCTTSLSIYQIRQFVDDKTLKKFEKFSQKMAIENDPNLMYCPRNICQSVARRCPDLGPDVCYCSRCCFYFCLFCKKTYHGVEICNLLNSERLEVIREYQKASAARQAELEKRFTKQVIRKWIDDHLTDEWLQERSKPCPNCKARIEKNHGCNKMTCFNCGVQFCWLCDSCLNRLKPYDHFSNPQSVCYQKLFPEDELAYYALEDGEVENEDFWLEVESDDDGFVI